MLKIFRGVGSAFAIYIGVSVIEPFAFPYSIFHDDYHYFYDKLRTINGDEKLDVTNLNKGNWSKACLFGGYTYPSMSMKEYGRIGFIDSIYQPMKSWPLLRIGEVEEHETLVAYVDNTNAVTFVHLNTTVPSGRLEYREQCISKEASFFIMPSDS